MKKLVIAIDIGDTLLDRSRGKTVQMEDGNFTYPLFNGAIEALNQMTQAGHTLYIISKIDRGDEGKVTSYLTHHKIIPQLIPPNNLYFCYEREAKAAIAKRLCLDIIIDDRVQVHNAMVSAVATVRFLFLESHDDRQEFELKVPVLEVKNWLEVMKYVNQLSQ
jgi:hypothetical protein